MNEHKENGTGSFDFTLAQVRLSKAAKDSKVLYRCWNEPYGHLNIPVHAAVCRFLSIIIRSRGDETARGGLKVYSSTMNSS